MAHVDGAATTGSFTVRVWTGDFKTLLAFNLSENDAANLAGFSIQVKPGDATPPYYLLNKLRFEDPSAHAEVAGEGPFSSANAPFRKFRWLHVPGPAHAGQPANAGDYAYTVTPRYFDAHGRLLPLDGTRAATLTVPVKPFVKGALALGFTRGYIQSQAYVDHFGPKMVIQPPNPPLLFPSDVVAGKNAKGESFTYDDEWAWLGASAHEHILGILNDVAGDAGLRLDMFAYDLSQPRILELLLKIAGEGRMRLIQDDSTGHHDKSGKKPEDQFCAKFPAAALKRGTFGRYAHDKILIVYGDAQRKKPLRVLTGSTNFSVSGIYVNANHVLVYDDPVVTGQYATVFQDAWDGDVALKAFVATQESARRYSYGKNGVPQTYFTFAPHTAPVATRALKYVTDRIGVESTAHAGSVLFAVMETDDKSPSPVWQTLRELHASQAVFSYGISDAPGATSLYKPGTKDGILVTGKPGTIALPPPFDQVPSTGMYHEIHHKFVVCGFTGADPTVFCGSSNLATGGEENNGDNLMEIHDADVAAAFALEAIALVDHYDFLDKYVKPAAPAATKGAAPIASPPADQRAAAVANSAFLATDSAWTKTYYDPTDMHARDRELFGAGSRLP